MTIIATITKWILKDATVSWQDLITVLQATTQAMKMIKQYFSSKKQLISQVLQKVRYLKRHLIHLALDMDTMF